MGKKNIPNIEFGMELVQYKEEENQIIAIVKNTNNEEEEITCQYLVGCDGVHSTVRKGINDWAYEGQTLGSSWALADLEIDHELIKYNSATSFASHEGADIFLMNFTNLMHYVSFHLNKSFYEIYYVTLLGPIAIEGLDARKNTVCVIVKVSEEASKHETKDNVMHSITNKKYIMLKELQKLIDERIAPIKLELKNPVWISNFKISERIVSRYRTEHAFITRDAAHCHSPFGGQGMNLGFQDAHNLAFKLALAIRGQAADVDKLIKSYKQERHPIGKKVVSGTSLVTKMWTSNNFISIFLQTRVVPFIFHFFSKIVFKFHTNSFQTDFNYLPETSEIFHKYETHLSSKNKLIKAGHYALDRLLKKITLHKRYECITLFDIFRSTALKHTLILFTQTKGVTADCNPLIHTLLEIYGNYKSTITPIIISDQGAVQTANLQFMLFQEEGREQHIFIECKFELYEKYSITNEARQQAFVLVRPDLYIACAVLEDDVDELKAF
ncbi:FAD binding domain-containing protein [Gigaspora margarita]|uniref:FAD binding domain-containing protein n=1 Tax=Gigaspora margarita TaxID=4874 RepID=A0A8H4AHV1_GIGMA|nr:FAD binding domain-containing protein [Gigaspora margarita]